MPLYFEAPHTALQPFINAYILYEQNEAMPSQTVIPIGSQFLWIVLKGNIAISSRRIDEIAMSPVSLLGFFTHAFNTKQTFPSKVAAVNFKPYGSHALFGLNMIQYQNSFYDFTNGSINAAHLQPALHDAHGLENIKAVLDEWLLERLEKSKPDVGLIIPVIQKIDEKHGNITVEELMKIFYITERTLQRLFSKAIGVNPKLYLRIQRFNYVLTQLENESMALHKIIAEAGYFDQSHFIKDFLEFTNCNPSVFKTLKENNISRQTLAGILKAAH